MKRMALVVAFILLLTACGGGGRGESVIVAGSTSVQPYAEILAEEYTIIFSGKQVDVQGGGSSAGTRAALSGTADIGMSSRMLTAEEQQMWNIEIARDGLVLITHPRNPLTNLTLEQVQGIYTGEITHWSQIGGGDSRIHVVTREEGSGTRGAFEEMVMGGLLISQRAIVQNTNGSVRQLVSGDVNAIGFISLGLALAGDSVKAMALDGVPATWENVMDGSYTLFRPFIFVANGEPEGLAKSFIDYVMSPAGQQILVNEGLISTTGGTQ